MSLLEDNKKTEREIEDAKLCEPRLNLERRTHKERNKSNTKTISRIF